MWLHFANFWKNLGNFLFKHLVTLPPSHMSFRATERSRQPFDDGFIFQLVNKTDNFENYNKVHNQVLPWTLPLLSSDCGADSTILITCKYVF